MRTRRLWMSLNPSPNSGEKLLGRARNLGTSSRRTFKSILPLGETKGPGPARISLPRSAGLRLPFLRTNRRLRAAYPRESLPRGGAMRRRPHASGEIPLSRIVPRGGGAAFTRDCESLEAGYLANSYDSFRGLISMRAGNKRWLRGINRPADPRGEILDRLIETRFWRGSGGGLRSVNCKFCWAERERKRVISLDERFYWAEGDDIDDWIKIGNYDDFF